MTDPEILRALYLLQTTGGAETRQNATITRMPEGIRTIRENNLNEVDLHECVVDNLRWFAGYSPMTNTLYVASLPGEHESKNFTRIFVYEDGRAVEQRVSYKDWSLAPTMRFVESDADGRNPIEYVVTRVEQKQDKNYVFVSRTKG